MRGDLDPSTGRRVIHLDNNDIRGSAMEGPRLQLIRPLYFYGGIIEPTIFPGNFYEERKSFINAILEGNWDFALEQIRKKPLDFLSKDKGPAHAIAHTQIRQDYPVLLHLCRQGAPFELLKRLLELGADPRRAGTLSTGSISRENITPMHVAAFKQDFSRAGLLNTYGAGFDVQDSLGETPLHLFFQGEKLASEKLASFFVSNCKSSINTQSNHLGETPLHLAVFHNSMTLIDNLHKNGARTDLQDFHDLTPLESAINERCYLSARALYPISPESAKTAMREPTVLEAARESFSARADLEGVSWTFQLDPDVSSAEIAKAFEKFVSDENWSAALGIVKISGFDFELITNIDSKFETISAAALIGDKSAQDLWMSLATRNEEYHKRAASLLISSQQDEWHYQANEYNFDNTQSRINIIYTESGGVKSINEDVIRQDTEWIKYNFNLLDLTKLSPQDLEKLFLTFLPTSISATSKFAALASILRRENGPYSIDQDGTSAEDKQRCVYRIAQGLASSVSIGPIIYPTKAPIFLKMLPTFLDLFSQEMVDSIALSKAVSPKRGNIRTSNQKSSSKTLLEKLVEGSFLFPEPIKLLFEANITLDNHPKGILNGANLNGASLVRYDFVRHTLLDCDLSGADLSQSLIGTGSVEGSLYSDDTKFPANFNPRSEGMIHRGKDAAFVVTVKSGVKNSMTFEEVLKRVSELDTFSHRHPNSSDFTGVSGIFHTHLLNQFTKGGSDGQYALLTLLPHLLFRYGPEVAAKLGYAMDGGFYGGRSILNPSIAEYLAMLNHPKNPKFSKKYTGPISIGLTSLPGYIGAGIQITSTTIYNWARIGTLGLSFLKWRFDAQRLFKDGEFVGPSLFESYGMTPLNVDPYFGSGFSFQRGKRSLGINIISNEGRRYFPFDPEALVVLRRAYLLSSSPNFGTLIIRNSSPVFGREKLPGAAYWSPKCIGKDFTKEELEHISLGEIQRHFTPILDTEINKPRMFDRNSDLQTDLHVLIAQLDAVFQDYAEWKFDTSEVAFNPEFIDPNRSLHGGYLSPGFRPMLDFLEAGIAEGKSYDLAFASPAYIPWSPFIFVDGDGRSRNRLSITPERLKVLRQLSDTGHAPNQLLRETGIRNFIQDAGFKRHGELIILTPTERGY